jgi:uncharacterized protein YgfB (UPF0149 family)
LEQAMIEALSAVSVAVGSALAAGTQRYAARTEALEWWAGAFLILGFGLMGAALPHGN